MRTRAREPPIVSTKTTRLCCSAPTDAAACLEWCAEKFQILAPPQPAQIDGHNGHEVKAQVCALLRAHFSAGDAQSATLDAAGAALDCAALTAALASVERSIVAASHRSYNLSVQGACVVLVSFDGGRIFCASVGDCKAVAGVLADELFHNVPLSGTPHNAGQPSELFRLLNENNVKCDRGTFYVGRDGLLQTSRAIGDAFMKHEALYKAWQANAKAAALNVSHEWPGTALIGSGTTLKKNAIHAKPEPNLDMDEGDNVAFVILASDGLWDNVDGSHTSNDYF